MKNILLSHGSGGKASQELLQFIYDILGEIVINQGEDSGIAISEKTKFALTTDSYVIDPIFFPGGDIGKLAICGTLNDLAMVGAKPKFITLSFIIEENFSFHDLKSILQSIRAVTRDEKIKIIAGDTKIVSKGKIDKIFINTSGYGLIPPEINISSRNAQPGDAIIVTGDIGDHGAAIMATRNGFETELQSDCSSVSGLIQKLIEKNIIIHTLRDPTRGGLASILNEIARSSQVEIELEEAKIPIKDSVIGICDALGIDPYYMACEGRAVIICPHDETNDIIEILNTSGKCINACKIGSIITKTNEPRLYMKTFIGSRRILPLLSREQTPRIC